LCLSFDYRVPLDPAGEYQLLAQKQPGTGAVPLEVRFTLPEGYAVSQTGAGATSGGSRAVSFNSSLSVDQRFAVGYRQE